MATDDLVDLEEPKLVRITNEELLSGKPIPALDRLKHFSPSDFEDFTLEYGHSLKTKYFRVVGYKGAGDKGRDVIAFKDKEGKIWDNYQCKHYPKKLTPSDALIEIAKMCYYTFIGDYTVPRKYYFISPQGPGPKLADYLDNKPEDLKDLLMKEWDKKLSAKISESKEIKLNVALASHIKSIDFTIFSYIPSLEIIEQHKKTAYHTPRFGGGLAPRPSTKVPTSDIKKMENLYVGELLAAYSDKEGAPIKTLDDLKNYTSLDAHLLRQRKAFFSAETLRNFARDNMPPGSDPFAELKEDVFGAIIDTVEAEHENGFERINAATAEARKLQVHSNALKTRLESPDLPGICHHLVNDKRVKWTGKKKK